MPREFYVHRLLTMNATAVWYLAYHENYMYTTHDEYNRWMIFGMPRELYVHYLRWIQPLYDIWHTTRIICTLLTMNTTAVWYLAYHENHMYTTYDEYNRCMIFGIPRELYVHYLRWIQPLYDIWHTTRIIESMYTTYDEYNRCMIFGIPR